MYRTEQLHKLFRFAQLYGWQRALTKAIGRTRSIWIRNPLVGRHKKVVSLVGCGQFAFSCICFYLQKNRGNRFLNAFDTNAEQAATLSRYYGFTEPVASFQELLTNPEVQVLYIASNHASHTHYAIAGLQRGLTVYVEKPISVSYTQLVALSAAQQTSVGRLFAGYNRPYSAAIQTLREWVAARPRSGGFSISYFINGHQIPADHWYRDPAEGTRVCGNLGHWIDLTVHIWQWRGLPRNITIQIAYANSAEPDDNLCVTFTTDQGDVVSMILTARTEPFEGINESISFQFGGLIAHIDDFRSMTIWEGSKRYRRTYRPKDVGHQRAVLQPFEAINRDWQEVSLSTLLMLYIKDMVLNGQTQGRFDIPTQLQKLATDVARYAGTSVVTAY
jgi:predicted dehydrogenase